MAHFEEKMTSKAAQPGPKCTDPQMRVGRGPAFVNEARTDIRPTHTYMGKTAQAREADRLTANK